MSKIQIGTFKPPSTDDPVLSEVVRRLCEVYHPIRIYLFGSVARGDAGTDSDYDIMVILPDDAPPNLRRGHPGYRALRGTGAAVDVQVWPQGNFNRQLHLKASLPSPSFGKGNCCLEPDLVLVSNTREWLLRARETWTMRNMI